MVHVDPLLVFEAVHYFFETEALLELEASHLAPVALLRPERRVQLRERLSDDRLERVERGHHPSPIGLGGGDDGGVALIDGVDAPHSGLLL